MELNEIRNKIDETDAALVELFRTRSGVQNGA